MWDIEIIIPAIVFLSFVGSLLVFVYLYSTEKEAPIFSYTPKVDDFNLRAPLVSIIVTAKNEEQLIESCVVSLLAQTYSNFEIIVMDDSSTDGTAKIVSKLASNSALLRLVQAGPKPEGWVGKSWPCWRGFQEAKGDYLLFVDADSTFQPRVIERSVLYVEKNSIDMFSVAPQVRFHGIWAASVLPLVSGAINLLYPLKKVNDKKSKRAYVFGTYFLIKKEVYMATGGHSRVRDQLVEDAAFAQVVKSAGYRLRVEVGDGAISTEWESDPRSIYHGLERVVSSSIKGYGMASLLNAVLLFFLIVYPVLYLIGDLVARVFTEIFSIGLLASALNIVLFLLITSREMRMISRRTGPEISLYFLGGVIFIIAIMTTSLKIVKGIDIYWKGQGYKQTVD